MLHLWLMFLFYLVPSLECVFVDQGGYLVLNWINVNEDLLECHSIFPQFIAASPPTQLLSQDEKRNTASKGKLGNAVIFILSIILCHQSFTSSHRLHSVQLRKTTYVHSVIWMPVRPCITCHPGRIGLSINTNERRHEGRGLKHHLLSHMRASLKQRPTLMWWD